MNDNSSRHNDNKQTTKPNYWKRFWIAVIISYFGSLVFSLILFQIYFVRILFWGIIFGIVLGFAYFIRIKPSIKLNKVIYILFGVTPIGFGLWLIYGLTGMSRYLISLGSWYIWLNIIIMVSIFVIGGFIGNWLGKKREYRLPFSPN